MAPRSAKAKRKLPWPSAQEIEARGLKLPNVQRGRWIGVHTRSLNSLRCLAAALHPTRGSWLSQAEIGIGLSSRQCPGSRSIPDLNVLRGESRARNRHMNRNRTKINCQFDRETARRKFRDKRKHFTRSENQLG
jgi:hypothetical protein